MKGGVRSHLSFVRGPWLKTVVPATDNGRLPPSELCTTNPNLLLGSRRFFLLATRHSSLATSLHLLAAQGRAGFNRFSGLLPIVNRNRQSSILQPRSGSTTLL